MVNTTRRRVLGAVFPGTMIGLSGCSDLVGQEEVGVVDITGSGFDPCNLEVPEGSTVMWENHDDETHTVTSASDNWDIDAELEPGAVVNHEFRREDVYDAVCSIHGDAEEFTCMRIRIAVGDVSFGERVDEC